MDNFNGFGGFNFGGSDNGNNNFGSPFGADNNGNNGGNARMEDFKQNFSNGLKQTRNIVLTLAIIFLVFILATQCFYIVDETEHAIKFRFDEIVEVNVNNLTESEFADLQNDLASDEKYKDIKIKVGAGLRFKLPFVEQIEKYSNQLITYDSLPREVITSDKKKIILDNNAQWWIVNPVRFRITMKSINSANQRIEDLMYSKMNEKVGRTTAHDLISNKEYVENMLIENADELNTALHPYGIHVADIRIKRTDLPAENNENIFNRMRTERKQKAIQYRSEGKEEAEKIRSEAEKEAAKIRAEANAEAQRIKGKGDAEAAEIFNNAYNADPEFYRFYKTLETYKATLPDSGAKIVISPDSEFAQYLFHD